MNTTETICEAVFCGEPWLIVYCGQGFLIIARNTVTAYIFLTIRSKLKRTSYLLINLTVADLFVGMAISLYLWDSTAIMKRGNIGANVSLSAFILDLLASTASLLSLSLISLERLFAILWPFRHRLLETWYYFAFISGVWLLSAANTVYLTTGYLAYGRSLNFIALPLSILVIISILITTSSYLAIWISIRRSPLQNNGSRSLEQNRRLAKTLFLVTILSLTTWLPIGVSMAFQSYFRDKDSDYMYITFALQYSNSLLNPIVYCFKMPEFKQSLKHLFCRCLSQSGKSVWDDISKQESQAISLTSFKSVVEDFPSSLKLL